MTTHEDRTTQLLFFTSYVRSATWLHEKIWEGVGAIGLHRGLLGQWWLCRDTQIRRMSFVHDCVTEPIPQRVVPKQRSSDTRCCTGPLKSHAGSPRGRVIDHAGSLA